MRDLKGKIDVEKLIALTDDVVEFLGEKKDANNLTQHLEISKTLQSHCALDFIGIHNWLQDYQKKIGVSKKSTDEAKSEVAADSELDLLLVELKEELHGEILIREELRVIASEVSHLELQRVSIEEQRQVLRKLEQDKLQEQMKLSTYASVTSIIPVMDNNFKITGFIVERDNKAIEKFSFDHSNLNAFDTCNVTTFGR